MPAFKTMHVSAKIGRTLQCISSPAKRDHYPIYAEFKTQSIVHMQEERHRWDRDRMMKAVKGDYTIRSQFIEAVEDEYESEELQQIIDVAETKVTPDE